MKSIILIIALAILVNNIHCAKKARGVLPERASFYDETKPFSCLDGSGVIPFSQVNDDYCDCRDGSDEPGTSACMNGSFACENLGYIVQSIPSSRINDGICDCCDGSDEYESKATCANKCTDLAAKMREEEERVRQLKEQGFVKRKELIELGEQLKKTIQAKIEELEAKKVNTAAERAQLETSKNEAEAKAKEAKDKQDKIFEEKKKELEKIETERKAKILFDLLDLNKDLLLQAEELVSRQELDILFDNDGKFTIEESVRLLDQNNHVSFEVFSTTYYEKISPHIEQKPKQEAQEQTQENQEHPADEHDHDHDHDHEHHEHDHEHDHEHEHEEHEHVHPNTDETTTQEPPKLENKYDEETQRLIDESDKARRSFDEADRNLNDIEREINEAKKKLELDVGPNGEFSSMIEKCFEMEDREYIYKLCPFDKTVQKSKSNNGETSIGNWKGWGDDPAKKYLFMKFDNGLACWNGPQRSTNVFVSCGIENKLTAVSEPNRCEYEMRFETPAVCDDANATTQATHSHDDL